MPMSSIEADNATVYHAMMQMPNVKENEEMDCDEEFICQGNYQHFTDKGRLELGKRASKHGITLLPGQGKNKIFLPASCLHGRKNT